MISNPTSSWSTNCYDHDQFVNKSFLYVNFQFKNTFKFLCGCRFQAIFSITNINADRINAAEMVNITDLF